jgi:hypothetical protein
MALYGKGGMAHDPALQFTVLIEVVPPQTGIAFCIGFVGDVL